MDTPVTQSARYINTGTPRDLAQVELVESSKGGTYLFATGGDTADMAAIERRLGGTVTGHATQHGKPISILHFPDNAAMLLQRLQKQAELALQPVASPPPKSWRERTDLVKLSGWIGNAGQVMMTLSGLGLDERNKGQLDIGNRDGRRKIASSVISLGANGMNSVYGVQRKLDEPRLERVKQQIGTYFADNGITVPSPTERQTQAQEPGWIQRNSMKVSNGGKLIGKLILSSAEGKFLQMGGILSSLAKVVTLVGMDEDPFKLHKNQGPLAQIRRRANPISGVLEALGNVSLITGAVTRVKNPDQPVKPWHLFDKDNLELTGLKNVQWFQLTGSLLFMASLASRGFAPFTVKKLDWDELTAFNTKSLAAIPPQARAAQTAVLAGKLVDNALLPEARERGYGQVYVELADKVGLATPVAPSPLPETTRRSPLPETAPQKPVHSYTGFIAQQRAAEPVSLAR